MNARAYGPVTAGNCAEDFQSHRQFLLGKGPPDWYLTTLVGRADGWQGPVSYTGCGLLCAWDRWRCDFVYQPQQEELLQQTENVKGSKSAYG